MRRRGSDHVEGEAGTQAEPGRIKRALVNFATGGMVGSPDVEKVRKAVLLNVAMVIAVTFLLIFGLVTYLSGDIGIAVADWGISAMLILAAVHVRRTKTLGLATAVGVAAMAGFMLFLVATGGVGSTGPLWAFGYPMFVCFVVGPRAGAILVPLFVAAVAVLLLVPLPMIDPVHGFEYNLRIVASLAVVSLLSYAFNVSRARVQENLRREQERLIKAFDEIKALSGFIPICSACKRVRDDEGYWEQVEHYVESHTDAAFTHGMCPECAEKLYPGFYSAEADGQSAEGEERKTSSSPAPPR